MLRFLIEFTIQGQRFFTQMSKYYYTNHGFWDKLLSIWDEVKNRYFTQENLRLALIAFFIVCVPMIVKCTKERNDETIKQQVLRNAAQRDLRLRNNSSPIDASKLEDINDMMESLGTELDSYEP